MTLLGDKSLDFRIFDIVSRELCLILRRLREYYKVRGGKILPNVQNEGGAGGGAVNGFLKNV